MATGHVVFMLAGGAFGPDDMTWLGDVLWHGLGGDMAMASYLAALPGLLLAASPWLRTPLVNRLGTVWLGITAWTWCAAMVVDAALYPYWGFRLDSTPLFYLTTSPSAAMASTSLWQALGLLLVIIVAGWGVWRALRWLWLAVELPPVTGRWKRLRAAALQVLLTALLVIPMRGGITVSTMNPAQGYFAGEMRIDHATVNPLFSFMHSLMHRDDLSAFDTMDPDEARRLTADLLTPCDTLQRPVLNTPCPDVYLVILESFSNQLLTCGGGNGTAANLDSLAAGGIYFSAFCAESFRTDRALATILGSTPAMPTASVMRMTPRLASLPRPVHDISTATSLTPRYFYGGDIDFTNLKAYLIAMGWQDADIVRDSDFDVAQRLSKWGAHDGPLFDRVLGDDARGTFNVIQTSSSHEPFEVPGPQAVSDARLNAFAYTDSMLGRWVRGMKARRAWDNALIIITADHWGCWPEGLEDRLERHLVPLVITGGALADTERGRVIDTPVSQSALMPTLAGMLGVTIEGTHPLARDIFSLGGTPGVAWMCEPDWYGVLTPRGFTAVSTAGHSLLEGNPRDALKARALLQTVYNDINNR